MTDPCFSCPLPDCDESDKRCALRRLANSYSAKRQRGQLDQVTDEERDASAKIFRSYQLERLALAAEGVRPFNRNGSAWRR